MPIADLRLSIANCLTGINQSAIGNPQLAIGVAGSPVGEG